MTDAGVFVVDALRTPVGRHGGALAGMRPDDLACVAMRGVVERLGVLDPAEVDDVMFGNANAHRLQREGLRYALVTMCIGVGQGIAVVLER